MIGSTSCAETCLSPTASTDPTPVLLTTLWGKSLPTAFSGSKMECPPAQPRFDPSDETPPSPDFSRDGGLDRVLWVSLVVRHSHKHILACAVSASVGASNRVGVDPSCP